MFAPAPLVVCITQALAPNDVILSGACRPCGLPGFHPHPCPGLCSPLSNGVGLPRPEFCSAEFCGCPRCHGGKSESYQRPAAAGGAPVGAEQLLAVQHRARPLCVCVSLVYSQVGTACAQALRGLRAAQDLAPHGKAGCVGSWRAPSRGPRPIAPGGGRCCLLGRS